MNRSGIPPMIASAIGRPSVPARTADSGAPPTATHTGSGSCTGRGYTPRSSSRLRVRARPGQPLRVANREQHPQLLVEQRVVVVQVVAEERERLDERAAAGHDLGAPAREQVERGEVLEHAHRVVRAQHRTALVSRIRFVRAAAAPSTTAGADTAKSGRWCSPSPNTSSPTWSASSTSSIRFAQPLLGPICGRSPGPDRAPRRCRRRSPRRYRRRISVTPSRTLRITRTRAGRCERAR